MSTETTQYDLLNGTVAMDVVTHTDWNEITNAVELIGVQLGRQWGAGIMTYSQMNLSDGGSGQIAVSAGMAIVGDAGSERIKLLPGTKTLANPGNGTWYVYITQTDDTDGTPAFSVTASATPAANTHQVGQAVISAGAYSSGGSTRVLAPSRRNLKSVFIPLPLEGARLIASNAIPNAAANGGLLASDTDPILERVNGATDKALRIKWAAASVIEIQLGAFPYPLDLDDTAPVLVHLTAKMSGATNTPTVAVGYFEGVGDTNAGGNTAALSSSLQTLAVEVTAANIGAAPTFASVMLTPAAHGTDALELYGAFLEYSRK